jgi:hypothetical protein
MPPRKSQPQVRNKPEILAEGMEEPHKMRLAHHPSAERVRVELKQVLDFTSLEATTRSRDVCLCHATMRFVQLKVRTRRCERLHGNESVPFRYSRCGPISASELISARVHYCHLLRHVCTTERCVQKRKNIEKKRRREEENRTICDHGLMFPFSDYVILCTRSTSRLEKLYIEMCFRIDCN